MARVGVVSRELGALLVVQRLCLPCLADRSGLVPVIAEARIGRLASRILVRRLEACCDGCRAITLTYGVQ
jgi:hypothetical protein